jgi:hypothetical protein
MPAGEYIRATHYRARCRLAGQRNPCPILSEVQSVGRDAALYLSSQTAQAALTWLSPMHKGLDKTNPHPISPRPIPSKPLTYRSSFGEEHAVTVSNLQFQTIKFTPLVYPDKSEPAQHEEPNDAISERSKTFVELSHSIPESSLITELFSH